MKKRYLIAAVLGFSAIAVTLTRWRNKSAAAPQELPPPEPNPSAVNTPQTALSRHELDSFEIDAFHK
jgi:hypothetical protein